MSASQCNLVACEQNGQVFLHTVEPVPPETELLFCYSDRYRSRFASLCEGVCVCSLCEGVCVRVFAV